MTLLMQILVALGVGLVIYAVYSVFVPGSSPAPAKFKIQDPDLAAADPGKEQKIQRLQSQVAQLEGELAEAKTASSQEKSDLAALKEKEAGFNAELKRREEWVAKAESELAKIKTENVELTNKFTAKEKELEDEFTKNVNLTREVREIKATLEAKEMACRLKEDQLQAQKQKIEAQLKAINEHTATIAEYSRKEKISEWVPKSEFNQLNEEYTKLEKEFEANQERLKNFAAEIAHLRPAPEIKKAAPPEESNLPEAPVPQESNLPPAGTLPSTPPQESREQDTVEVKEVPDKPEEKIEADAPVNPAPLPAEAQELEQADLPPEQENQTDQEATSLVKDNDRPENNSENGAQEIKENKNDEK